MAELDVEAVFMITVGGGAGPETWVAISTSREDGSFEQLSFPKHPQDGPVDAFVALSAMFGPADIPLYVVEVQSQQPGFCAVRVQAPSDVGVKLEDMRPVAIGIVVDTGKDRGQTLACACPGARPTPWAGTRTRRHQG
jgi:hypothetical protein